MFLSRSRLRASAFAAVLSVVALGAFAAVPAASAATGVKVQYKNNDTAPQDNQIKPGLQLVNTGTSALDLSTVTVRYYFTHDSGATTYNYNCDYAAIGCGNVHATFASVSSPTATADTYLQLSFTGSLSAGASSGDIQNRINKSDWTNFDETNDYSYGTNTSYADATTITVYVNGTLVAGTEPGGSGSTDTTPPSAPTGLTVTGTTSSSAALKWAASTDNVAVTGYDILRNGVQVATTTATVFTDTGLTAATAYSYTVKAFDAAGNASSASAAVTATTSSGTNDTIAPSAPTGVTVSSATASSVSLTWTASSDNVGVTGYDVYRDGTLAGTSTVASFTDTGLTASTAYTYTVKAFDAAGNVSTASAAVTGTTSAAGSTDTYTQHFLDLYNEIHDPANGYFSPQGIPYHSVETLIVEAPDYGHETTSEAYSFWMWLEATYGQVTGDWTPFNNAWATMEKYMIPQHADQPTNASYNPSKPATYAPEHPLPSDYPSQLDTSVSVGQDPLAAELSSTYGTSDIYGMQWIADVDNKYGFGDSPGGGCELGPSATGTSYINTFQRGPQESVWETITQPTCDKFTYGGPNGYLDLFVKDSSYAQQWKFTDAPDADARAVEAAYWAYTWATAQGKESQIAPTIAKAAKMGDYLRYSMFDKYFKQIGNCTSPTACPAGTGKNSDDYLLGWYYAWGGSLSTSGGWAWRIGDATAHFGYQNPLAAYALSSVPALEPKSPTAPTDWATSLQRQLEFYQWLQSSEGAIAGGATNSWGGAYGTPPAGDSTFYGMYYDPAPVYHDPPSNDWFGMQTWSMERVAEYYYVTGDAKAKAVLDKWVAWVMPNITADADGTWSIPSNLDWSGQPDTWNPTSPGTNAGLHVTITSSGQDVGLAGSLAKLLSYYAAKSGDTAAQAKAKALLDDMWANDQDSKGITTTETRTDYSRFDDVYPNGLNSDGSTGGGVYVPPGWSGKMPNGDVIAPGATFLSLRSWYKNDPDWPKVQAYLDGGPAPTFNYHRFWAQSDIAMAYADYGMLFGGGTTGGDTTPPSAPTGLKVTATTASSVSLSWTAATDNVGVTGYRVFRGSTLVGSPTSRSFTDTGLSASTAYSYSVKAVDAAGNVSAASTAVTGTTSTGGGDTIPPSAPTGVMVSGTTSSSVSLSWTAASDNVGVTGYQVFRGSTLVGSPTSTSFTDTGLNASTAYTYTVKAVDAAGNVSAASAAVSATTASGSSGGSGCAASFHNDNDWGSGFNATVTVTDTGTAATKGWKVTWTWGGNQQIVNSWNATLTSSGNSVTATNLGYNGAIAAGGNTSFGLQANYTGTNTAPTLTCTAG